MRYIIWIGRWVVFLAGVTWLISCAPASTAFSPASAANTSNSSGSLSSSQAPAAPAVATTASVSANSSVVSTAPAQSAKVVAWPQHLNDVVTLPQQLVGTDLEQLVGICVQAVNLASSLNGGQATTAGTVRQGAEGNYAYESAPADALFLIGADGSSSRFAITALTGDLAKVEDFLGGNHSAQCAITSGTEMNLEVASSKVGQQQERRIRGTVTNNGQAYSLDLALSGTLVRDGDSSSKDINQRTAGEIRFGNVVIRVDESRTERGVSALSTQQAEVNSEWIEGATRYQLQNMFYDIAFDQSGPSELNTWQAKGVLLSNGTPIGQVGLRSTGSSVELFAEGSSGRTVLNSWSR